jgi:hypothetical protein
VRDDVKVNFCTISSVRSLAGDMNSKYKVRRRSTQNRRK